MVVTGIVLKHLYYERTLCCTISPSVEVTISKPDNFSFADTTLSADIIVSRNGLWNILISYQCLSYSFVHGWVDKNVMNSYNVVKWDFRCWYSYCQRLCSQSLFCASKTLKTNITKEKLNVKSINLIIVYLLSQCLIWAGGCSVCILYL